VRSAKLVFSLFAVSVFVASPAGGLQFHEPPRVTWTTPDPAYPLKVRVFTSARSEGRHAGVVSTHSYGSANLLGTPAIGLDYSSDCEGGFMHNGEAGEFYEGRWKKQDRQIEILVVQTGKSKPDKCTIDVTVKAAPYSKDNPPPKLVTAH
jgi:hypothetical protein